MSADGSCGELFRVRRAQHDLLLVLHDFQLAHELTDLQMMQALLDWQRSVLQYKSDQETSARQRWLRAHEAGPVSSLSVKGVPSVGEFPHQAG